MISNICHQYQPYLIIDIFNELLLSDTRPVRRSQIGGDSKVAGHAMDAMVCYTSYSEIRLLKTRDSGHKDALESYIIEVAGVLNV